MISLVIASHNPHKIQELQTVLEAQHIACVVPPNTVREFPKHIPETGATLEENAYIKAVAVFHATGQACIADDTGLEVDVLGGAPGVYTARYAGESASYAENRAKLLKALEGVAPEQRTARFRTVICYHDALRISFAEGVCEGRIAQEERGEEGFGYDAVFIPSGYNTTFAEMRPEAKHAVSHRGKALRKLAAMLQAYQSGENDTQV
ncbi:MAG: RdgB/HAM1 family non-canonical purine NTP pyrophosphatase [Bacteroidota bacterium]|nr:RdgB/HAM1 family non-canonical purine NTP pyrophosphatase [Candidatus Kapabacteria bacterium]MDW8219179.1 RdgB/HAM1 family non-canonical purine NTP pyrophosphatase [Bacteroidota bacterium]